MRPWARPWRRGGLRQEALPEQQAACTGTRAGDGLRELPAAPSGHLGRPLPGQACSLDAQGAGEHRVSVEREQAVAETSECSPARRRHPGRRCGAGRGRARASAGTRGRADPPLPGCPLLPFRPLSHLGARLHVPVGGPGPHWHTTVHPTQDGGARAGGRQLTTSSPDSEASLPRLLPTPTSSPGNGALVLLSVGLTQPHRTQVLGLIQEGTLR